MRGRFLALVLVGVGSVSATVSDPLSAQGGGSFADAVAQGLYEGAVANRLRFDDSIVRYTALVRQRIGAALRMPLKDRTLYRVESAHRVHWERDGGSVVQILALREQTPLGVSENERRDESFQPFDPTSDRLLFGLMEPVEDAFEPDPDDFWLEHPLEPRYRDTYHFSTGDTLTLALPDGRSIRAVELRVVPAEADVHRMTGSLWIVPETGALVRAVYRLSEPFDAFRDLEDLREEEDDDLKHVPGIFKPWTADISVIAVEYSLWNFDVWLPRSLRAEGVATAGILTAPASVDISYEIESVVTDADVEAGLDEPTEEIHFETRREAMEYLSERMGADVPYRLGSWNSDRGPRGRRRTMYLVPEDPSVLATSPHLPPPVWEDAPGFTSEAELRSLLGGLGSLPQAPAQSVPRTLRWGLQRPDLVRFNRVEALSLGARGQLRPMTFLGPLSVTATARLGPFGDLEPNGRVDVTRETLRRRVTASVYHELAAVDEDARHLGLGNSVTALLFGRDDGDYYRRSGTSLEWTPPSADRASFRVRGYAEYHRPVEVETTFSLWHVADDVWRFRGNVESSEGWELGGLVTLSPSWGSDPRLAQGGLEATAQAAGGDVEYARASLSGRLAVPLPGDVRLALEAGGGTSWGAPPPERWWLLGGATTLRGYGPAAMAGTSLLRARGELARHFAFGAVALFTDAGWAGDRDEFDIDDGLTSIGLGLSLVDGLIRLDGAWGLRGPARDFRVELYLDGIL